MLYASGFLRLLSGRSRHPASCYRSDARWGPRSHQSHDRNGGRSGLCVAALGAARWVACRSICCRRLGTEAPWGARARSEISDAHTLVNNESAVDAHQLRPLPGQRGRTSRRPVAWWRWLLPPLAGAHCWDVHPLRQGWGGAPWGIR